MIDWLEKHPRITSIQNLRKGELVCGNIIRKHQEMGYVVELAGGSALTAPARFIRPMTPSVSMRKLLIRLKSFFINPLNSWLCVIFVLYPTHF